MNEEKCKWIMEGNACYELDLDCMKRKEEKRKKKIIHKQSSGNEKGQRK